MASNTPNPAQNIASAAGRTGALTDTPTVNSGFVYMGSGFAGSPTGNPNRIGNLAGDSDQALVNSQVPLGGRQAWSQAAPDMAASKWTVDKALAYFGPTMDPRYMALAQQYADWRGGGTPQPPWTVQSQYERAVTGSSDLSVRLGQPITPWQWMQMDMATAANVYGSGGGGGGGSGGGPSTTTQVSLSSQSDAEALVDQALTTYLGRQATDGERDNFWKLLNKAQAANPTVTHSSGGPNNSVVQSGGLNENEAAKEFALHQKDSGEYMANTQYHDWLMEKITADPTEAIQSGL